MGSQRVRHNWAAKHTQAQCSLQPAQCPSVSGSGLRRLGLVSLPPHLCLVVVTIIFILQMRKPNLTDSQSHTQQVSLSLCSLRMVLNDPLYLSPQSKDRQTHKTTNCWLVPRSLIWGVTALGKPRPSEYTWTHPTLSSSKGPLPLISTWTQEYLEYLY